MGKIRIINETFETAKSILTEFEIKEIQTNTYFIYPKLK